jgi:hypothetical protein
LGVNAQIKKIQNRPYIDQRRLHYGILIGLHTQDLKFENNGYITKDGESWFADVASYSPGFSVGVLGELYLTKDLALRLIPTLHFGDKTVIFKEQNSKEETRQQMGMYSKDSAFARVLKLQEALYKVQGRIAKIADSLRALEENEKRLELEKKRLEILRMRATGVVETPDPETGEDAAELWPEGTEDADGPETV